MSQCFLFVPLVHPCLHGAYRNTCVFYVFYSFPALSARIFEFDVAVFSVRASGTSVPTRCLQARTFLLDDLCCYSVLLARIFAFVSVLFRVERMDFLHLLSLCRAVRASGVTMLTRH